MSDAGSSSEAVRELEISLAGIDPVDLLGPRDSWLRLLQERTGARLTVRGERMLLRGTPAEVAAARAVVERLLDLLRRGRVVDAVSVEYVLGGVAAGVTARPPPGVAVIHLDPAQTPVYGLELRLHYDASSLQDLAITPGPLAQGLAISSNLGQAGEARIALAGATPLTQAGDLLTLHWQPAPAANALPHITWAQVNEGRAAVDIPAPPAGSSLFLPLLVR